MNSQMEVLTDANAIDTTKEFIQHILRKYKDDEILILRVQVNTSGDTWEELKLRRTRSISFSISKKNSGETLKHKDFALLVLGKYRLFVFTPHKKELKVCHNIPLIELERIEHLSPSQFRIKTSRNDLRFIGIEDEVAEFLAELYTTTLLAFPGLIHKIDLCFFKESEAKSLRQQAEDQFLGLKCGGYVRSYEAMCSYLDLEPRFEICWDVDNLYHFNDNTDFRLSDFKSLKLSTQDYTAMFQALHYNPWFKSLSIDFRPPTDVLNLIPPIFKSNIHIESLQLKSCGLSRDLCSSLRRAFESNSRIALNSIDISDNSYIEDKGLYEIIKYLDTSKVTVTLLDISGCNISEKGMNHYANKLYEQSKKVHLSTLNLSGNRLDSNSSNAFAQFFSLKTVTDLNLSGTNPDFSFLGQCENLTSLDLSHCGKSLKDFKFIHSCTKLKKLNISDCGVTSDMLKSLFSCETFTIEELDLSDNSSTFGDQGVMELVEILKGRRSELKHLKLNRNFEAKVKFNIRSKTVESLIELCKFTCQYRGTKIVRVGLESLQIQGNSSKLVLRESILPFIYSLLTNQTLRVLDISGNHSGDALGAAIGKVLQTNAFLEEIYMDDNHITDFTPIRNAFTRNRSLRYMQHPSNDLIYCFKSDKSCKLSTIAIINEIQQLVYKNCLFPVGISTPPGAMTPVEEKVRMTEIKKRTSTKFVIDVGRASTIFVTSNENSPAPPPLVSRDSIEEDFTTNQINAEKISLALNNLKNNERKGIESPSVNESRRHLGDRSMSLYDITKKSEVSRFY